jgi:hypothetical protein
MTRPYFDCREGSAAIQASSAFSLSSFWPRTPPRTIASWTPRVFVSELLRPRMRVDTRRAVSGSPDPTFSRSPICSVLRRIVRGRENSTVSRTDSNVLKRAVRPG